MQVRHILLAASAAALTCFLLLAASLRPDPLPALKTFAGRWPDARPPAEMAVFGLVTGTIHRNAAIAYRGGALHDTRPFAMAGTLVRHPQGDLLIDTGFGRDFAQHFARMPRLFRWLSPCELGRPARDQLASAGYDFGRLRAILLTHAHWDHVSGIPDFPGVPVEITRAERRFIREGGAITEVARSLGKVPYREYGFDAGPYLGFAKSRDVYGDGSVVVVPAPGHTPGSVIVFLTLPNGARYALVGDLAWQREGITQREEKPWFVRALVDDEAEQVRGLLVHMASLSARFPELVLVPAHDARAFALMRKL